MLKPKLPQWLRRFLWIGFPLIASVTVGGIWLHRQEQPTTAFNPETPRASATASPDGSPSSIPSPMLSASAIASSPLLLAGIAPQLSSTITSGQTPSASSTHTPASETPPLTASQEALNQQAIEEFHASMPTIDASIEIQVAIAEGVSSISFSSTQAVNLRDRNGRDLHTLSEGETYTIRAEGNAIALGSWQLPTPVWIEIPPTGIFRLGDRSYRGQLLLVADSGRLWAVNYVNLRHYLYSVVGSEVSPSWDMEALKAQAVAARSYALTYYFRPANSLYHLGATERYQVYRGIEREANRTSQAVDETAGEFVSHRGGIVESLYAASDDIVAEAFQGRGMSQLGALNLAEQGYSYQQILSNYYPGTGVGRIEQDYE